MLGDTISKPISLLRKLYDCIPSIEEDGENDKLYKKLWLPSLNNAGFGN